MKHDVCVCFVESISTSVLNSVKVHSLDCFIYINRYHFQDSFNLIVAKWRELIAAIKREQHIYALSDGFPDPDLSQILDKQ